MYWVFSSSRVSRPLGLLFIFYDIFSLIFVNMGLYRKNSTDTPESTQQIHSQKFMFTPNTLYQSCSKNCEKISCPFWIFANFLSFSLAWDHVKVNVSEGTHQIYCCKFMYNPRGGSRPICSMNFEFLATMYLKTTGLKAKLTQFGPRECLLSGSIYGVLLTL